MEPSDNTPSEKQFVAFSVGGEEYGQDISSIHEINRVTSITAIPHTPQFVIGVVNLRGKIIPVIEMRRLLGLPEREASRTERIIVLDVLEQTVGLLVDEVHQVLTIRSDELLGSPGILATSNDEFVKSVAKIDDRLIVFLDLDKLVGDSAVCSIERPGTSSPK